MCHILYHFGATRADVYKRIFQVLYYGSGLGKDVPEKTPTYVYPMELREEIRRRFDSTMSSGSRDAEFQDNPRAVHVTWEHLHGAKCPKPPKTCCSCESKRPKSY